MCHMLGFQEDKITTGKERFIYSILKRRGKEEEGKQRKRREEGKVTELRILWYLCQGAKKKIEE